MVLDAAMARVWNVGTTNASAFLMIIDLISGLSALDARQGRVSSNLSMLFP